jgi:hypothetical protein
VPIDLFLVTVAKALVELAGLFILGHGVLYVLAGHKRAGNPFYQLFQVLTRPVYALVRLLTPKVIVDRHVPWVALILLFWIWVILTFTKIEMCAEREDRCQPQQALARTSVLASGDRSAAPL